jgi:hypothetical protein
MRGDGRSVLVEAILDLALPVAAHDPPSVTWVAAAGRLLKLRTRPVAVRRASQSGPSSRKEMLGVQEPALEAPLEHPERPLASRRPWPPSRPASLRSRPASRRPARADRSWCGSCTSAARAGAGSCPSPAPAPWQRRCRLARPIPRSAQRRRPRQWFWLVSALFRPAAFATACHRLQPRGSTKAPSLGVNRGNMRAA